MKLAIKTVLKKIYVQIYIYIKYFLVFDINIILKTINIAYLVLN